MFSSGRRLRGGIGFSVRCFISVDIGPLPLNGTCPVSISYMMQPSAY